MSEPSGGARYGEADDLENVTFDELVVGQSASLTRRLDRRDLEVYGAVTGDTAPSRDDGPGEPGRAPAIGDGLWGGALISAVLGTKLPGPGTIYLSQQLRYHGPIRVGDTVTARVRVRDTRPDKRIVHFDCHCANQDGDDLITGIAEVIAPDEKVRRRRTVLPEVQMIRSDGHASLVARCAGRAPLAVAVVHPCDEMSLRSALDAAAEGLIHPVLIGPEARMRAVADQAGLDLGAATLVAVEHSHAAADTAVRLAHAGEVSALMKGSLHTDELMGAVVRRAAGLRTERRISHGFVMTVPGFPRPLVITDAAINIEPSFEDKVDICRNAIDLAHALGIALPRVALLSASDRIDPRIPSTFDAAALCKMAERGQIVGARLDGPLALDTAISAEAAQRQRLVSPVAGHADVLVVPDLESGNMVAKQLSFMANAEGAGIVLGARVPIILTSRADDARTRRASCALAVLLAAQSTGSTEVKPRQTH